jgi:hypothetical protein
MGINDVYSDEEMEEKNAEKRIDQIMNQMKNNDHNDYYANKHRIFNTDLKDPIPEQMFEDSIANLQDTYDDEKQKRKSRSGAVINP